MKLDKLQKVLLTILNIIDYSNDKNTFINEFSQICLQHTIAKVLQSFSPDQQKALQMSESAFNTNPLDKQMQLIKTTLGIRDKDIEELFLQTSRNLFEEYVQTITPTLSSAQKEKLTTFLQENNSVRRQKSGD